MPSKLASCPRAPSGCTVHDGNGAATGTVDKAGSCSAACAAVESDRPSPVSLKLSQTKGSRKMGVGILSCVPRRRC